MKNNNSITVASVQRSKTTQTSTELKPQSMQTQMVEGHASVVPHVTEEEIKTQPGVQEEGCMLTGVILYHALSVKYCTRCSTPCHRHYVWGGHR